MFLFTASPKIGNAHVALLIRESQYGVPFACFDATAKGVFGPTGTTPDARGRGIGAALLQASLAAMREAGYAYAVIGGASDEVKGFYQKSVGASEIAGSEPGMYQDSLDPL